MEWSGDVLQAILVLQVCLEKHGPHTSLVPVRKGLSKGYPMVRIDKIYLHQPSALAGIHQARQRQGRHPEGMATPLDEFGPSLGRHRIEDAVDGFQRKSPRDSSNDEAGEASWPVRPWEENFFQSHLAETWASQGKGAFVFGGLSEPSSPAWASQGSLPVADAREHRSPAQSEPPPGPLGEVFWGAFVLLPLALMYGVSLLHPGEVTQYYVDLIMMIYMAMAGLWVWQVSEWSHLLWQCLSRGVVLAVLLMLMSLAPAFDVGGKQAGFVLPTPARIQAHFERQAYKHPLGQLPAHQALWQAWFCNHRQASDIQLWAFNALCLGLSLTCLTGAFQRPPGSEVHLEVHQDQRQHAL